jgi:aminopeptidase N
VEDDLWTALQTQVDLEGVDLPASVKEIMDSWTVKMGFPYITVLRDYFRESAAMVTQVMTTKRRIFNIIEALF